METIINDSIPTKLSNIQKYFPFVYLGDIFIKLEEVDKNVIPCEIQKIIVKKC